jgi:beta-galactosidase
VKCDSYETGNEPDKMIDENPNTIWHTAYNNPGNFAVTNKQTETDYPHEVQIELANDVDFSGFTYVPRTDGENGLISSYAFYISNDGKNWGDPVVKGSFNQSVDRTNVLFKAKVKAKYIRFVALSGFDGQKWASMADLELIP